MTSIRRRPVQRAAGLVAAALVALAPLATAGSATGVEPEAGIPVTDPPPVAVLPSTTSSSYFDTPRDLTGCPYRTTPPAPVDESEVPLPGGSAPAPPPVPDAAPGGDALAGCEVAAPDGFEVPGDVTASAWLISDLDTGEVVAAKDPHGRYRPASIIKTLLASVALDSLDREQVIEVSDSDLEGAEGSLVGIGPGGKYSVHRLMCGLLMSSGNDAAVVLAHRLGGIEQTLGAMNNHAAELGASSTYIATVNGLDGPGMMTTAYDMSLIFRDAMTRPEFAEIVATESTGFPGYPAGEGAGPPDPEAAPADIAPTVRADGVTVNPGFVLGNDNQLLYNYPGAIGGKTGFTDDARHTFIGAAERDGRRLAVVLLDGTRVPSAPWQQAAGLLDAGFAAGGADPVGMLDSGQHDALDDATEHLASGPLGSSGKSDSTSHDGSLLGRYGPWLALGAAGVAVLAGAVLTLRSRN
ncbi:D-alanyl-D-alanine carboxypeptidase family protein [Dietzia alimentaria]|uniref:D-alanyl-D-alanine carboxypeptidase family protein n=1 Tax=Dietzia alimentaria TaxID=665550 RepID=UPI00029A3581|nr:D-alanyl-D-alanine carboxypeptidase family protein [Dietzia alimentaria]